MPTFGPIQFQSPLSGSQFSQFSEALQRADPMASGLTAYPGAGGSGVGAFGYTSAGPNLFAGQPQSSSSPITANPPLAVTGLASTNPESISSQISGLGTGTIPAIEPSGSPGGGVPAQSPVQRFLVENGIIPAAGSGQMGLDPGQPVAMGPTGIPTWGPPPKPPVMPSPIAMGPTGVPTFAAPIPPPFYPETGGGDPTGDAGSGNTGAAIGDDGGGPAAGPGAPGSADPTGNDATGGPGGGTAGPGGVAGDAASAATSAAANSGVAGAGVPGEAGPPGESGDGGGAPSGGCRIATFTMDQLHLEQDHPARLYWSGLSRRWLKPGEATRRDLVRHAAYMRASKAIVAKLRELTPCEQKAIALANRGALVDAVGPDTPVEYGVQALDALANHLADELGVQKPRRYRALAPAPGK